MVFAAYDRLLDEIVQKMTPEDILALRASDDEQARAVDLLVRRSAGTLTPDEQTELDQIAQFDRLVGLLKARAAAALRQETVSRSAWRR
jgi:hypothetical protein